jgi:hypothetical protein
VVDQERERQENMCHCAKVCASGVVLGDCFWHGRSI